MKYKNFSQFEEYQKNYTHHVTVSVKITCKSLILTIRCQVKHQVWFKHYALKVSQIRTNT
jgi:hypothetical protein